MQLLFKPNVTLEPLHAFLGVGVTLDKQTISWYTGTEMDLHVFLIERKRRIKDIAKIESPHERLRQLAALEKWVELVHQPGWVIGHRLAAIERLRAKKEILFEQN